MICTRCNTRPSPRRDAAGYDLSAALLRGRERIEARDLPSAYGYLESASGRAAAALLGWCEVCVGTWLDEAAMEGAVASW